MSDKRSSRTPWVAAVGIAAAFVLTVAALYSLDPIAKNPVGKDQARALLTSLGQRLQVGMSRSEADGIVREPAYAPFRVLKKTDAWAVLTPPEIGARNWTLLIEFESDRIAALRFRTEDSNRLHPDGAPADRVSP